MQPYNSGGSPLAGAVTQLLYPDSATNWLQLTAAFNFAETLSSDPDHYEFILSSGPSNTSGNGVWVAQTSLSTLNNSPSLSSSGTTQVKWQSLYNTIGGGYMVRDYGTISYTDIAVDATTNTKVTSALTPFTSADVGKTLVITGGTGFTPGAYTISTVVSNVATLSASPAATSTTGGYGNRSGSGVKDFSQVGILAMACTSPIPLTDLFLRFGFVQDGTDTIAWSNDILFNATGTVAYCDISTLTGSINLADIRYLYIQAVLDLPLADIPPNTKTNVLTFGPLTSGGNLTVGQANYIYYVTETAVIDEFDSIQSNPSAGSANVIPTDGQAQAQITIPADCPKNALTTQYSLWRLGGVWDDTRLIATVGKNATVGANGANATDSTNPYYSYASGVFIDNTPDIWLTLATLISFGRDPMPTVVGAQAEWQGRRWAAVGNTLYGSWLANSDTSAGMMTTLILDTSDPNAAIEGCNFPISQDPTDTIVRLIPYGIPIEAGNAFGGGLLVLNKRSVFMVQGTDPTNFAIRQYDYDEGIGLIAQRGVARISANQLIFMGPDRLHVFPPQGDAVANDVGLRIQPALYPAYPRQQVLQNATAFAKSWMMYHDSAIYLGAPMPGDAAPSVVWKYDLRVRGWTRWTGTQVPVTDAGNSSSSSSSGGSGAIYYSQMNFTSGRSMPPNALGSPYELYFYGSGIDADGSSNGLGGQLYVMQGSIDIETPIATATAIPCTVTVHAFRPGFFYRFKLHPLYYREARLEFIEIEMILNGLLTMTAQAYNAGPSGPVAIPGAASVQQYTLTGLGQGFRKEMPSGLIEGQFVTLTLTFDCGLTQGNTTYVRGVRGHVTQTGQGAG
jgi:hypothetical protein